MHKVGDFKHAKQKKFEEGDQKNSQVGMRYLTLYSFLYTKQRPASKILTKLKLKWKRLAGWWGADHLSEVYICDHFKMG